VLPIKHASRKLLQTVSFRDHSGFITTSQEQTHLLKKKANLKMMDDIKALELAIKEK
jgi:hypothetical protein